MKENFETIEFDWKEIEKKFKLAFEIGKYQNNGRRYIGLIDIQGGDNFSDLTINIPSFNLVDNEIIIDNDCPSELIKLLEKIGILEDTLRLAISGYSLYNIEKFNYEKAKKYICYEEE